MAIFAIEIPMVATEAQKSPNLATLVFVFVDDVLLVIVVVLG
jgi:hypothetical protein